MVSGIFSDAIAAEEAIYRTDTVTLNEITITSIKQNDRLYQLPVASTFIGSRELEQLNAVNIKSISDVVPNFYIPDYGSRITSSIYVRGLGARMDQPAVGLNVDNVPFLNKDAYDFDLADIVSVEMLRGPQSTLYGRNTMGGQINVTTLSPLDYQGWRFQGELSSGGSAAVSAGWYGLLRANMGLSVTAQYRHQRGFFRNAYTGKYLDKENSVGVRVKYDWRPVSTVRVQNVLSLSNLRQGGYPYEYLPTGEISYNDTCFYRRFLLNDGLTVRWYGENVTLSSITSVQHLNDNMTLDQDFLPRDYFTLTQKKRETGFTEDLILRPSERGEVYDWTTGLFGFYKHLDMDAPVTFKDYGISQLIEKYRNDANPDYPIAWDTRSFVLNSNFKMPVFGLAAYHESKVKLGRWRLTAGLRLEYERPEMRFHSWCDTGYMIYNNHTAHYEQYKHTDVKIDDSGKLAKNYFSVMPKICALYELSDNTESNLYANISRGYKSGGFNTQMFSDVLQQRVMGVMGVGALYDIAEVVSYKPEESWNFEVGTHLIFPEYNLNIEAALFYILCRNQQMTVFPDGNTTGRIMTNAGKTRSFGGEFTARWNLIESLTFMASYGYTNAKFIRFNDGKADYAGNYLPYAPLNTLFLQGLYELNTGWGAFCRSIVLDVNMRGTGKIYWNESNTTAQNFYALLGAGVTFSGDKFSAQLWAKNITSTKYYTFYFVSIGNEFVQRGKPFQIGVTLNYTL